MIAIGPEGDPRRQGLVLSGHMDVVPADEADWRSDPFVLTVSGETLVGRGAADMKGFLRITSYNVCYTKLLRGPSQGGDCADAVEPMSQLSPMPRASAIGPRVITSYSIHYTKLYDTRRRESLSCSFLTGSACASWGTI